MKTVTLQIPASKARQMIAMDMRIRAATGLLVRSYGDVVEAVAVCVEQNRHYQLSRDYGFLYWHNGKWLLAVTR